MGSRWGALCVWGMFPAVASSYARINIGNVAVMITIDGIRYGPISMLVQWDEAISGRGKYNIATRKADMQLFLNR